MVHVQPYMDLKLILLGAKNVGKTSIFNRYVYDEFGKTSMTIGAYFGMKQISVDGKQINLAIWDTAGEEKFDALTNFYCRNARAALICYDMTSHDSFANLQRWIDKINLEAEKDCAVVIIGNKLDLADGPEGARRVSTAEAKAFADKANAHFFEASAKSGVNVSEAFEKVVQLCLERQGPTSPTASGGLKKKDGGASRNVDLNAPSSSSGKGCCS